MTLIPGNERKFSTSLLNCLVAMESLLWRVILGQIRKSIYTRTCYLCIMRSNSTGASAACLWETIQLPHDLRPLSTYVSIKQAPIRSRSRSILYDNIRAKWIFRTALAARSGAILSARWQSLPPTESFS